MSIKHNEILRFGCIGAAATATHFLVLWFGVELLALPPAVANGLAFLVALFVTFFGQGNWVFQGHGRLGRDHALRFAVSVTAGLVANVAIMSMVTRIMGLPYQAGFVASVAVVASLSFFVNRRWVFR